MKLEESKISSITRIGDQLHLTKRLLPNKGDHYISNYRSGKDEVCEWDILVNEEAKPWCDVILASTDKSLHVRPLPKRLVKKFEKESNGRSRMDIMDEQNGPLKTKGFYIRFAGDHNVGIFDATWTLSGEFHFDSEDDLEQFKDKLLEAWELCADASQCWVETFEEYEEVLRKEDEMYNLHKEEELS